MKVLENMFGSSLSEKGEEEKFFPKCAKTNVCLLTLNIAKHVFLLLFCHLRKFSPTLILANNGFGCKKCFIRCAQTNAPLLTITIAK